MVEEAAVESVTKLSLRLSAAFAVFGVGLVYLFIGIADVSIETKILWAAALSLGVALGFLLIWTMAMDMIRDQEREQRRKSAP